jgi:hypothetical protein
MTAPTKGCPGLVRINSALVGICIACDRLGKPDQIEPDAKRLSGGEWFCPNRRYTPAPGAKDGK